MDNGSIDVDSLQKTSRKAKAKIREEEQQTRKRLRGLPDVSPIVKEIMEQILALLNEAAAQGKDGVVIKYRGILLFRSNSVEKKIVDEVAKQCKELGLIIEIQGNLFLWVSWKKDSA
ncbi:hypothetical protein ACFL06_00960 [Patescibacteria group bacterium]